MASVLTADAVATDLQGGEEVGGGKSVKGEEGGREKLYSTLHVPNGALL